METLRTALAAFATKRSAWIAAKIEELGRTARFAPPLSRKTSDFQRAWIAAVTEPEARSWCLGELTSSRRC